MSLQEPLVHALEAPNPYKSDPSPLLAAAAEAMLRCGLAAETRRIYLTWLRRLLTGSRRGPAEASTGALARELDRLSTRGGHGASSLKQARAAARFLLGVVLARPGDAPALQVALGLTALPPAAPTREDVCRLLAACPSGRDRLLVGLVYGSGLRLGEALRLCAADLDLGKRLVSVPATIGRSGRVTPLPLFLVEDARAHLSRSMPWDWVFTRKDGRRLGTRGAQRAIERAAARCGLEGRIHSRSLRRGFVQALTGPGEGIGVPGGVGSPL